MILKKLVPVLKLSVLYDDKEALVLLCTKRAVDKWLIYLLAEGMKTLKHGAIHCVELR